MWSTVFYVLEDDFSQLLFGTEARRDFISHYSQPWYFCVPRCEIWSQQIPIGKGWMVFSCALLVIWPVQFLIKVFDWLFSYRSRVSCIERIWPGNFWWRQVSSLISMTSMSPEGKYDSFCVCASVHHVLHQPATIIDLTLCTHSCAQDPHQLNFAISALHPTRYQHKCSSLSIFLYYSLYLLWYFLPRMSSI